MKLIPALLLSLIALSFSSQATCYGTGIYKTCTDTNGNSYTITKYGSTTQVNGYSANTGSTWSQNSSKYGSITITNGTAANGSAWSSTTTKAGGTSITNGTDSKGNAFSKVCTQFGCY